MAHKKTLPTGRQGKTMTWTDSIKKHLPMEQMLAFLAKAKTVVKSKSKKDDPNVLDAEKIIKRINMLLSQNSSVNLGKQAIYKREVKKDDGTVRLYTYIVDFNNAEQVKRLRTFLTELIDLETNDASKAKKKSIPGYLDYIAQESL